MNPDVSASTLSTFTSASGENIAVQEWPVEEGVPPRGTVLLVHGLGEHAGRYEQLARSLNAWGFTVRGYDQYGHGESEGVRGGLPAEGRLLEDLADIAGSTRQRMEKGEPLVLLGHSMGGLVAAAAVAAGQVQVDGLVLSSPALRTSLKPVQRLLLATIPRIAPGLVVGNGIDAGFISRDPQVVAAYRADPRVHDRISARLARFIAETGRAVIDQAPRWRVPTLLMYAGQDRLVDPSGSREFADAMPSQLLTGRCFAEAYHEIFNEPDKEEVFRTLRRWLDERFPA